MTPGQSDSFIVLRDGRTDHMGKERTERPNEHSQHASGRIVPNKSVSRTLLELRTKAERDPKHRFRSLYREIDLSMLYESFRDLKRKAAPGVDGVTVEEYEKDLDSNLRQLLERLVGKTYRAQNGPMETLVQLINATQLPLRGLSEEPGAGKPHAGICEGAGRKRPVLP